LCVSGGGEGIGIVGSSAPLQNDMTRVKQRYKQIKQWFEKYERVLIPGTLVFGVVVDSFTFANIEITTAFVVLGLHVLFAGGAIAFLNAYDAEVLPQTHRVLRYIRLACPLVIQFTFGALLSAAFVFYVFSGSLVFSWPFIALIVILMVTNDVLRKYYLWPRVQMGVYFFILFSVSAIILPYVSSTLSAWVFLLSGALSLLLIYGYIRVLARYIPTINFGIRRFIKPIAIIFVIMNSLYFLNVIPPIPLSLKDSAVARHVNKGGDAYNLMVEEEPFLRRLIPGETIHKRDGETVAVYTAIFAPGDLHTAIYHHWQHKEDGKWVTKDKLSFGIFGGRKEGFRGYSIKTDVPPGKWRVDVETKRGQVLGRVHFRVEEGKTPRLIRVVK